MRTKSDTIYHRMTTDEKHDIDNYFTEYLGATDSVASFAVSVSPASGLTVTKADDLVNAKCKVWLGGSTETAGDYTVTLKMVSTLGVKESKYIKVTVT